VTQAEKLLGQLEDGFHPGSTTAIDNAAVIARVNCEAAYTIESDDETLWVLGDGSRLVRSQDEYFVDYGARS